ncbi:MAG TPA: hypothetical protein VL093_14140 [Flavipsychrobacter sp.]|nr:hypothetical protein [Flavipsychrobacter sp.]
MKRILIACFSAAILMGACKKDDESIPPPSTEDSTTVVLSGDITANRTLTADKKYLLKGFVYVKSGATLTIEAGSIIKGDKATKGTLVITRGGKIDAEGTPSKPIIFTSSLTKGARNQGDWGGVILLGKAPINPTGGEAKIEGGLTPTVGATDEKAYIWYGGSDATDNSGIIKYCRIEFAGIAYSPDNEINGLTFGGVGSGTTISHIQVYRSGDDSYEWFGGTVNCDHLIATYSWDDDFDTDFGFSGKVQFGLAQRAKAIADVSGSNGFESDNDGNGSTNTPQTRAFFSNMTIVGPIASGHSASGINANFQHGAQIRRNSSMSLVNSLIVGFPVGIYIDNSKGTKTINNVISGSLKVKNNIIAGCPMDGKTDATITSADSVAFNLLKSANGNVVLANVEDVQMVDPFKYSPAVSNTSGTPSFLLKPASPALSGADFSGLNGFQTVSYRGAFDGNNDWTSGWATWNAENNDY